MAQATIMTAEVRDRAGKGAARATRRAGRVPAVIYGNKEDPQMISLDPVQLIQQLQKPGFFARVCEVDVAGDNHKVLPRDIQLDPVTDRPLHVDFMRFSATTRVNVEIEVRYLNEDGCPGLRGGGVLNIVRHTIEALCRPDDIPDFLTIDLAGLEIGDSVHISSVDLPDGVTPTITDRDFTILTIAAPTILAVEDDEVAEDGAEGAEGEGGEEGAGEDEADSKE
ncbi:MAG: 50S ribosomal protein L25/general stress protein Ctc [Rhodospirillales bacterium]|jgi:large subunit ribosomal protein L25